MALPEGPVATVLNVWMGAVWVMFLLVVFLYS